MNTPHETLTAKNRYENNHFKSQDFSNLNLQHIELSGVVFENCNFTGADLRQAKILSCTFKNCNFSLVKLAGCRFQDVMFTMSKIVGADFYQCDMSIFSLKFTDCILNTANFSYMNMKRTCFKGSKIRDVHFSETNLMEADFRDTDLQGSLFHRCNLTKADFRNAKNYGIDPSSNTIKKAKFSLPEAVSLLNCLALFPNTV